MLAVLIMGPVLLQYTNLVSEDTRDDQIDVPDVTYSGNCLNAKSVDDLKVNRYGGKWFHAYQSSSSADVFKCLWSDSTYSPRLDGYMVKIYGISVLNSNDTVLLYDMFVKTNTKQVDQDDVEKYIKSIMELPGAIPLNYHVLATDYDNYSCVYGCIDSLKTEFGAVLVRDKSFSSNAWHHCSTAFLNIGMDPNSISPIDQNCHFCS